MSQARLISQLLSSAFHPSDIEHALLSISPSLSSECSPVLLTHPPNTKDISTSCIFSHALSSVIEHGGRSLILATREAIDSSFSFEHPSMQSEAANGIHIKYLTGLTDLIKYSACIHLLVDLPHTIIVYGLFKSPQGSIRGQHQNSADEIIMRALATLVDAAEFIKSKQGSGAPVSLTVAEEHGGDERVAKKFLFDRWCPTSLTLSSAEASLAAIPLIVAGPQHPPGSGSASRPFTLSMSCGSHPATLVLPCIFSNEGMSIERISYQRS
jgi:hypothetical protein